MNTQQDSHHLGQASAVTALPYDELLRYGRGLGLDLPDKLPMNELVQRVTERRDLLVHLDRDSLLDIIIWARRPVRKTAGKEELAREIARVQRTNYEGLSRRGLTALARLRGIPVAPVDDNEEVIRRLKHQEGLWERLARKRRTWVASWVSKIIEGAHEGEANEYQFLPEEPELQGETTKATLKRQIEDLGVVGGIANRIRGVADDYIRVKLDEIEQRIDSKLEEIDKRLAEWRDREVANRLRILRITLFFTVLVALLSLGYNYIKQPAGEKKTPTKSVVSDQAPDAARHDGH